MFFCVSCVVAAGVLWTVLGSLVQGRDWQTGEGLAKGHWENFAAPAEQWLGAGFAQYGEELKG